MCEGFSGDPVQILLKLFFSENKWGVMGGLEGC